MEAPEFLRQWGWGLAVLFIVGTAFPLPVFDYEVSTHAALTAAIIDAYNKSFSADAIADEFRFDMIRGSQEEDNDFRWLQHFYDPLYNRGLTAAGWSRLSSKQWATADGAQDFTWRAGIDAYARGDSHAAFLVLGHILHLLEDASVPEHTRNDLHPMESPYEAFTKTLMPVVDDKPPIVLSDRDGYFDAMARYANNYFYSADTLQGEEYAMPKPDYMKREETYLYGYNTDESGKPYHLVHYVTAKKYPWLMGSRLRPVLDNDNNKILSDYWRLLSAKAVRHGAGLTHTFLIEAEKARKERVQTAASSMVANIIDIFTPSGANDDAEESAGFHEAASIPLAKDQTEQPFKSDILEQKPVSEKKKETVKQKKEPARECPFAVAGSPLLAPIIINEVAWMGSKASANDEWIELKNMSARAVDVSGWQVVSERDRVRAVFPAGSVISAGNLYLLERTDDQTVPFVAADMVYAGALSNTNDGVRLFDKECRLMDEAFAHPAWPAGNADERRTMEAHASERQWHDYSGVGAHGIFGTPKEENSILAAPSPPPSVPLVIRPGSGSAGGGSPVPASTPVASTSPAPYISPAVPGSVIINEFLFDAEGADKGNEFVELYNPGGQSVSLSSWSIRTATAKKNFEDGMAIGAGQCFLVWLGIPPVGITPHMQWASGSLNNTAGAISLMAGETLIDRVSYSKDGIAGFGAGKSWERDEAGGAFHIRDSPSPGNCTRLSSAAPIVPAAPAPVTGAGFLEHVYFYKNPLEDNALIDIHWNGYPFIPGGASDWKIVVFYLNSAPGTQETFGTDDGWIPASTSTLAVRYPLYYPGIGGERRSVIMPDTKDGFGSGGGVNNSAYNYIDLAEDSRARMIAPAASAGDYITIGYYAFSHSGGGNQQFKLVFADPTRYFFDDPKPAFKPPALSGNITASFNRENGVLAIAVPSAADPDSLDLTIRGELTINGKLVSQRSVFAVPGDGLIIEYRARDEFGFYSASRDLFWQHPGSVQWIVSQDAADGFSRFIGEKNQNCPSCPASASFQSVSFANDTEANAVAVRLNKEVQSRGTLRLTLYADGAGAPDFSAPLATKAMRADVAAVDAAPDIAFIFDAPFLFKKNKIYWLALDVAEYDDSRSYYFPYLKNAVASGGERYAAGGAAYGTNGACTAYCSFIKDYPAPADWYMKIGMWVE